MHMLTHRYDLVADVAKRRSLRSQPKSWRRAQLYLSMAAMDVVVIAVAIIAASILWVGLPLDEHISPLLSILLPLYLLCALNTRAYTMPCLEAAGTSIRRAIIAFGWTILLLIGIGFYLKVGAECSRGTMALGALFGTLGLAISRGIGGWVSRKMLVDGPVSKVVLCDGTIVLPGRGETVLNTVAMGLAPTLHDPMMLDRIGHAVRHADRVIVACPPERRVAWANALKGAGVDTELLIPEFDELGVVATDCYEGSVTAVVSRGPLGLRHRVVKRCFDLFVVLWLLPVLLLVTAVVAVLIKLEDRGSVFFVQKRIGEGNRLFRMYKFRSMRTEQLDGDGKLSTQRNDSRVTRIGKFLRATSVDELPQLFNVLKGDMSIVGPRPHALASTAGDSLFWEVDHRYWGRHAAKPGLTGLAQIRGYRGATETESDLTNRVQADLEYLSGWTLWRDIKIVAQTFGVLLHHNAF